MGKPISLRLHEFPESRIRALMRVVRDLRKAESLELFAQISKLKARIMAKEVTVDDLFDFFDRNEDDELDFLEFRQMLDFYQIKVSFDTSVELFSNSAGQKGFITHEGFEMLFKDIQSLVIDQAIAELGFTPLAIALAIMSLTVLLV